MKEFLRIVKYALVAGSAGIIQFSTFALINEVMKAPYWVSYVISLTLSVIWNLTINRKATFRSTANYGKALLEVIGYYLVFTPLSMLFGNFLVEKGWNEYLVEIINMVINGVTEYLFMEFVVFRGKIDNAVKKENVENDD